MPDLDVQVRQIEPDDRLTGLKLGYEEFAALKTFLQKHAKKFHINNLGRTYAGFLSSNDQTRVIAYMTLVCGEVVTESGDLLNDREIGYPYRAYPAIKIARLAVDFRFNRQGLGRRLVELALGITKSDICPSVGCRFVVVDAKQNSVPFYRKCGFTLLDTAENKARSEPIMFLDMAKV